MNKERYVLEALMAKVAAAIADVHPAKYPLTTINPPSSHPWWEILYLPNNPDGEFWGDEKTYQGIVRLILHYPMKNEVFDAMDEVSRVSDQIKKGELLQDAGRNVTVKISEEPDTGAPMEEAPEALIPLTVRYTSFKV